MLERLDESQHPYIRVLQTTDDGQIVGYGTFYIKDLGTIPSVGDYLADINNPDDYYAKVVYQRIFVTEIFAPSYWLLLTRPAEPSEITNGVVETTLLVTDYYEATQKNPADPSLPERLRQLLGWPTKARRIKPKVRDPEDPAP
ncbi:hypothetical protein [Bosea sp. (in: a-proteobacteria)]|jgi:hypothetical protein|uniref:hypothetical protein n=1 Tax=Bosea sp. (in: a-proteobacteria) TaxID=1871050 RepID=UPI003F717599